MVSRVEPGGRGPNPASGGGSRGIMQQKIAAEKIKKEALAKRTAKEAAKREAAAVKRDAAKKAREKSSPISHVKIKPAAKPVGNPSNKTKAWESVLSSASRGGVGRTMGKVRDSRVFNSKKNIGD